MTEELVDKITYKVENKYELTISNKYLAKVNQSVNIKNV